MSRRKLEKYRFSHAAENVIERGKPLYSTIKGNWKETYFRNNNPITLELACGKGEYSIGLSQKFPGRNFIGIDIKGDRLARGSKIATQLNLFNVAFLRSSIQYLEEFFEEDEVDEIWLVHPDPQLREREEKKRLTNHRFLAQYAYYLKAGGMLHIKTDSLPLYNYTMETLPVSNFKILGSTTDLYQSGLHEHHHGISTHYERAFVSKGFTISYIQAINEKRASV